MIDIPISNPLRFRPLTGQVDVNFDNEFDNEYTRDNRLIKPFVQLWDTDIKIQVITDYDAALVMYYIYNGNTFTIDHVEVYQINGTYYYNFFIDDDIPGCTNLVLSENDVDLFESEPITPFEDSHNIKTLEWYNTDPAFGMEYTVSGMVCLAHIDGTLVFGQPEGESTVFDNLGTEVKLEGIVKRVQIFQCFVPAYLAEILTCALEHDHFYINSVEYIAPKKASVTQVGNSNIYNFRAELQQVNVIGINSHDSEFLVDAGTGENIINVPLLARTQSEAVNLPSGYIINVISIMYISGNGGSIKVGTTEGGADLVPETTMYAMNPRLTQAVTDETTEATTIYVTIPAASVFDLNVQLLKNIS